MSYPTAIVLGAGITGVSTALHLVRDGWAVTLLDRIDPGDPGQTSFGNAGLLARGSVIPVQEPGLIWKAPGLLLDRDSPLFLKLGYLPRLLPWLAPFLRNGSARRLDRIVPAIWALTRDTVEDHRALAEGTPAADLIRTGDYAHLFRDAGAFRAAAAAWDRKAALGLAWEERDMSAFDPNLGPDYGFGAVLRDHGWIIDPGAYVAALSAAFAARGGSLLRATATDIRPGRDAVEVLTDAGTLRADRLVLSAGIWSRDLAARLGLRVPMETERGYHLMLSGASHRPAFPMMLSDRGLLMTPMRNGLRVAGLVELGGTKAPPSEKAFAFIRRAIRRALPGLTWAQETRWMGHRPTTTDSLPVLGAVPGAERVICAFGGQHLGLTIGPRLGRLAADLAAARHPNMDLAPYAPGRFR